MLSECVDRGLRDPDTILQLEDNATQLKRIGSCDVRFHRDELRGSLVRDEHDPGCWNLRPPGCERFSMDAMMTIQMTFSTMQSDVKQTAQPETTTNAFWTLPRFASAPTVSGTTAQPTPLIRKKNPTAHPRLISRRRV